ncbi:MAG: hypothetical protein ACRDQX_10985 [Pseudonocardiaceae bacterium]
MPTEHQLIEAAREHLAVTEDPKWRERPDCDVKAVINEDWADRGGWAGYAASNRCPHATEG